MTAGALGLVLGSAVAHATWNLLAKRAGGGTVFVWLFAACSAVLYMPIAIGVLLLQHPSIGAIELLFIAGTAVLHLAYFLFLQRGYEAGDLSFVYPLARGTGPILATVGAIAILGERPSLLALLGTALITTGIVVLIGRLPRDGSLHEATLVALATGALIAAYTLWDRYAVASLAIPPLLLLWANDIGRAVLLTPTMIGRREEITNVWKRCRREVLGVAILSPFAYLLVLIALTISPASYVAPVREVGILFGAAFGIRYLNEAQWQRRLIGAGVIAGGVVALAIG